MSKILKRTGADYFITDTGETVPSNSQLVIDPAKYSLYARSDDTISAISSGDLVYNDGSSDLSLADATLHLQGSNPKTIDIEKSPPFASKKIIVNGVEKSLFKRVHGVSASVDAGQTVDIDFTSPYAQAKFTGAEIFGTDLGDELDFTVHDDVNNTYSGAPGSYYELNKFGYSVQMPPDRYKNTSNYDADVFQNMIIRCSYTNNTGSTKTIGMNVWLHEVK